MVSSASLFGASSASSSAAVRGLLGNNNRASDASVSDCVRSERERLHVEIGLSSERQRGHVVKDLLAALSYLCMRT